MKQRAFPRTKDISGQRFGKLVALYPISLKATGYNTNWVCQCDWAIITRISPDLIRKRWKAGWPMDAIFTEVEKPQLCWGCAKACGGCSWSKRFEPVPGWTAVPPLLCGRIPSYRITECPEFVSDGTEYDIDE